MVRSLYPQKWLPYHWLGPFAFDKWDAIGRLRRLASSSPPSCSPAPSSVAVIPSLWIRSGRDEIIPHDSEDGVKSMFADWVRATSSSNPPDGAEGSRSRWVEVEGALHDTAYLEGRWRDEVKGFLEEVARKKAVRRNEREWVEGGGAVRDAR
jgi:hypothetical protein